MIAGLMYLAFNDCLRIYNMPPWFLGTAQLGLTYGIANDHGPFSVEQVAEMLAQACECECAAIDTAQAYGMSETLIGQALAQLPKLALPVDSKLAPDLNPLDGPGLIQSVRASCDRLGRPLRILYTHNPSWAQYLDAGLAENLEAIRSEGLCETIGMSVYDAEVARTVLQHPSIDCVQMPANAWSHLDLNDFPAQSLILRSIFLQGLLVLDEDKVTQRLPIALSAWRIWQAWCQQMGVSVEVAALTWAYNQQRPLVLGADKPQHIAQVCAVLTDPPTIPPTAWSELFRTLAPYLSEHILDPRRWPQKGAAQ